MPEILVTWKYVQSKILKHSQIEPLVNVSDIILFRPIPLRSKKGFNYARCESAENQSLSIQFNLRHPTRTKPKKVFNLSQSKTLNPIISTSD